MKKVLVVGIGEHAKRRILPALSSVNGIDNIFITSRTEVKNLNSDHVFLSKEEILNSNYLFDSIIISSVPSVHIENLQEFRNKSKYFLIEKPLTSKLDYVNSNEFLDLNKNIDIKECLMYIHHPIYNEFKKIIRNNKLEKVLASFKIPHLDKNNFRYSKQSGASSILDQGIYPISLILENFTIDENSMINSISFDNDLNIDTGGNLKCKSSDGIDIEINWGIGGEYSNFVEVYSKDSTYKFDMFFSKPENFVSSYSVNAQGTSDLISIGIFDQFKIMYEDLMINEKKFSYNSYDNLLNRYKLIRKLIND